MRAALIWLVLAAWGCSIRNVCSASLQYMVHMLAMGCWGCRLLGMALCRAQIHPVFLYLQTLADATTDSHLQAP